jgi:mRNA interferase MazF
VTFEKFDVVVVPFPFIDSPRAKRRPALVMSVADALGNAVGHSVMAMITSAKNAPWPGDVRLTDLQQAGLPAPSVVRMKLFTLDHRLVIEKVGHLAENDAGEVINALKKTLGMV